MSTQNFNNIFPMGEENEAYAKYFVGQSYLNMLSTTGVVIGNVTFEPGCRNNWHIHHKGGQILLVIAGRGYYQEWGKPAQELNPGDDNDGCFFIGKQVDFVPSEIIDRNKEFCDCGFIWKFPEGNAHGVSIGGKSLTAIPIEPEKHYVKQDLSAKRLQ